MAGIDEQNILTLLNKKIKPGESAKINFNTAKLYTTTAVEVPIIVERSTEPGPVVLITGGIHGDEINGVEINKENNKDAATVKVKKKDVTSEPSIENIYLNDIEPKDWTIFLHLVSELWEETDYDSVNDVLEQYKELTRTQLVQKISAQIRPVAYPG